MPRRYTRAAIETGEYGSAQGANNSFGFTSRFKVEDFPDELLEGEGVEIALPQQPSSGPLEYIPTPKVKKEEEEDEEEEQEEAAEEPEDDEEEEEEEEYEEEEYVPSAPVTRRSSQRKSSSNVKKEEEQAEEEKKKEEAPKKEKKEKKVKEEKKKKDTKTKEQKKKEMERRKLDSELDAELRAAHGGGSSKSKKKKPEKPAYVGGLPTSSIQTDPTVSNPYNYDPKMEMVKLGTGQLKSAYRKTRNNVELRIEKNLYKLEPKRGSRDEDDSREPSEEPESYPTYTPSNRMSNQPILFDYSGQDDFDDNKPPAKRMKVEPISVDTVETPPTKKRDAREHRPSPSPYTPTPKVATPSPRVAAPSPKIVTPSPAVYNNKPKLSSPAILSSSSHSQSGRVHHSERRSSDANSAMRKGVYMPSMSRQDKMIAEGSSAPSSRHSSMSSERRPSFIPQLSSSRHSSTDTSAIYTPTTISTPVRSSWLPNTSAISRHSNEDDSLIDVVNDTPIDVLNISPFPKAVTPPPIHLTDLSKDFTNGHRSHHHDEVKKPKMPAKEAMAELKTLVTKLNTLNDA